MCILFPQSTMCSWVNVFYEEICPRNLAHFPVNILAVSFYLVVGLNFYPSLPRSMSADYRWFCEGWWLSSLNSVMVNIQRTPAQQERRASVTGFFSFPSALQNFLELKSSGTTEIRCPSKGAGEHINLTVWLMQGKYEGWYFLQRSLPRGARLCWTSSPFLQSCFLLFPFTHPWSQISILHLRLCLNVCSTQMFTLFLK